MAGLAEAWQGGGGGCGGEGLDPAGMNGLVEGSDGEASAEGGPL